MGRSGTEDTWRLLLTEQIRGHGRWLFRLACRVLKEPTAAEDVCQQAFLKAWEQRQRIRDAATLRSWLTRVVLNESFQARRRRTMERRNLPRCAGSLEAEWGAGEDLRESVLVAMEKLPEVTRMIVALRVMDGMAGNDVKEILGCSAAEVSRQLHSGMERLRELLADWQTGPEFSGHHGSRGRPQDKLMA